MQSCSHLNASRELSSPGTSRRGMCRVWRLRASLIAAALALVATAGLCRSAVLTVTQDGSGDYATVWEALEAAQNGDEIWIGPGYYDESTDSGEVRELLLWAKSFTIRGQGSSPDATTIVAVGVSVNIAITNLVMDAVNAGYRVVVPRDAVAGIPADYADAIIDNTISLLATVTTTSDLIEAWA